MAKRKRNPMKEPNFRPFEKLVTLAILTMALGNEPSSSPVRIEKEDFLDYILNTDPERLRMSMVNDYGIENSTVRFLNIILDNMYAEVVQGQYDPMLELEIPI